MSPVPEDLALHGTLSANVVGFSRHLRRRGIGVCPSETAAALGALGCVDIGDEGQFHSALRICLAKSLKEQQLFDDCFDHYWRMWDRADELNRPAPDADTGKAGQADTLPVQLTLREWLSIGDGATEEEEEETAAYSPIEVVTHRDFAGLQADELDDMSLMSSHDVDLKIDDTNASYFEDDSGRLCRTDTGEQQATWAVDGALTSIEATVFFWPDEDRPPVRFETSTDGSSFTEVPAGETELGGDWQQVLYTVSEIPEGSSLLRFSFEDHDGNVWNPQLASLVLSYE